MATASSGGDSGTVARIGFCREVSARVDTPSYAPPVTGDPHRVFEDAALLLDLALAGD